MDERVQELIADWRRLAMSTHYDNIKVHQAYEALQRDEMQLSSIEKELCRMGGSIWNECLKEWVAMCRQWQAEESE